MCAEVTYSALELGAGETQTTCGEDRLTPLLFLHHREAVPVSPAQMHQVSPQHMRRQAPSSVICAESAEFLHAGVVDGVFGAVVVAVAPKQAGSCNCGGAAALLRLPLGGAPPSIPQQHGVQHVDCGHKHRHRGTNITGVMIHEGFVHSGVQ